MSEMSDDDFLSGGSDEDFMDESMDSGRLSRFNNGFFQQSQKLAY